MPLTQRIGTRFVAHRSGVSLIRYLLRATFDAADQGYANGQVLDTVAEGVQDGTLNVVEVDGTLAIVSNECAITAQTTPTWGDLGFYSQAITRALGWGLLYSLYNSSGGNIAGWNDGATIVNPNNEDAILFDGSGNLYLRINGQSGAIVGTFSLSTNHQMAYVLGGYDVNGIPWRSGQAAANYTYGCAFFIEGGAFTTWTLLWRDDSQNTGTVYAILGSYNTVGTIDDFRVPDADLSAVLQPNNLSLFASAGELDAYTPELGSAWTEDIGDWDTASGTLKATTLGIATFTGPADCLYDAKITTPAAGTTAGGLALRITDLTGASEDYWYVKVTPGTAGTDWELIEYVAGTPTQRAFGDADWAAATAYQIRAIAYGTTIDCFRNGDGKITYASASSGQTATKMGLRDEGNANMTFDNVAVFPRTSSVYEAEFGRV